MLLPQQVIPFLSHPQAWVRRHASQYLAKAHDPSPATAEDFWRAIDAVGLADAGMLLVELSDMPQTPVSLDRTLQALRDGPAERNEFHLQRALEAVGMDLLQDQKQKLLNASEVLPKVREHLQRRLELIDVPPAELWQRLLDHAKEIDDRNVGEFDSLFSQRLIEALARHSEFSVPRMMEVLEDTSIEDWREIFAVQLAERLKHAPATPVLIRKLDIDADLLREEAVDALTAIGTVEVVRGIEAFYPGKRWDVRLYAPGPLGRIKRPESEAALLRLLDIERKDDLLAFLADALCDLCPPPEVLERIREGILQDRFDPQISDMEELVLAAGAMVGYEPPEAPQWRAEVEERDRRIAKTLSGDMELGQFAREMRETWRTGNYKKPAPKPASDIPYPPPEPLVRSEPKVGRNDPCPCGSGKKYKKCCLK